MSEQERSVPGVERTDSEQQDERTWLDEFYGYILRGEIVSPEKEVAFALIADLTGRSGLQNVWEGLDETDQIRTLEDWMAIVRSKIAGTQTYDDQSPHMVRELRSALLEDLARRPGL